MKESRQYYPGKRNSVLHRFYEPLVLLHVLDRIQGDHLPRQKEDSLPPGHASRTELRRRFLDSLAYACDYEKGGDTTTAVLVTSGPLTYYVASNKALPETNKVVTFLYTLLERLRIVDCSSRVEERQILEKCVRFSERRISTYRQFLLNSLNRCRQITSDTEMLYVLDAIDDKVTKDCTTPADLCMCCFELIKCELLKLIKEKAAKSEDSGSRHSPFADLRHFIGRLGNHVQVVKVLLAGASRFPGLIEDCEIRSVNGPSSPLLPPQPRNRLTLAGIVNRMTGCDKKLTEDLNRRLVSLNDALGIERLIWKEYGEKTLKPRVHAELVLLEYFYRNGDALQFFDNDRYIGASKPACYCCSLYIREHPGGFVQPATHQKIYLNWLPPTSTPEAQEPASETAIHERTMLNSMVRAIRKRTIEQVRAQTGGERRQGHYDSITWETLSNQRSVMGQDRLETIKLTDIEGEPCIQAGHPNLENEDADHTRRTIEVGLSNLLDEKISIVDRSKDLDSDIGVKLLPQNRPKTVISSAPAPISSQRMPPMSATNVHNSKTKIKRSEPLPNRSKAGTKRSQLPDALSTHTP